jgi:hypothetical protein
MGDVIPVKWINQTLGVEKDFRTDPRMTRDEVMIRMGAQSGKVVPVLNYFSTTP